MWSFIFFEKYKKKKKKRYSFYPCHAELILMFSQSDRIYARQTIHLIQVVDTNSHTEWQSVDPDRLASEEEANWSGSTLFAKAG